jgi:hypothetical protein
MLHMSPRETCAAACASRGWRDAVAVSGRLRRVLHLGPHDCAWSAPVLTKLFARFSRLEELHLSTEVLVPLEAVTAIAACFAGSLRCFSGFVVSNVVQGRQPAVSELAKITALESLTLEGTLLTGYSLAELGRGCTALRRLHCPEILSSHADLRALLHRCPRLEYLGAVNLSVHHEVTEAMDRKRRPLRIAQRPHRKHAAAGASYQASDGHGGVQIEGMPNEMRPNDADMSQAPPPLLKSLARIGSLGINLFTESDGRLTNQIAATLGHNLVSLRLRACSFSADALLECLVQATRLDSLSLIACNRAQGADGRGGGDAAVLDRVLTRLPAHALPALSSLDLDEDQVSGEHMREHVGMRARARIRARARLTAACANGSWVRLSCVRVGALTVQCRRRMWG